MESTPHRSGRRRAVKAGVPGGTGRQGAGVALGLLLLEFADPARSAPSSAGPELCMHWHVVKDHWYTVSVLAVARQSNRPSAANSQAYTSSGWPCTS